MRSSLTGIRAGSWGPKPHLPAARKSKGLVSDPGDSAMPTGKRHTTSAGEMLEELLTADAEERRMISSDVELARKVQLSLLPRDMPKLEGYEFFGGSAPSQGVSGDYFEIFERNNGTECVLLLADVSGTRLSASMLTGYLEALTAISVERNLEPHEILNAISGPFHRKTPADQFATMILAVLEPAGGSLRYASAGHPPAFVVRNTGDVSWFQPTGVPIGIVADAEYDVEVSHLNRGEILVLYSDGFIDAVNPAQEEFGADRMAAVFNRHRSDELSMIATRLECTIAEFTAGRGITDDRTLLMARRNPS